jgi:hypothetical protein
MTAVSLALRDPSRRLERLSNWLALLALLAGGIVFQDANVATRSGSGAALHGSAVSGTAESARAATEAAAASGAANGPSSATASSTSIATQVSATGTYSKLVTCYR